MRTLAVLMALTVLFLACGKKTEAPSAARYQPINPDAAVFWDRQITESAELMRELADEFNAARGGALPVKVEHTGNYPDIFRKVSASIQAGSLPSIAVGYQSMTAEYIEADAVVALEPFINDSERGLSADDLDDFFPAMMETNRYPNHDNKLYSFPFCKSVLILYFNKRVLADAGFSEPPKTWDEFLEQARQIKAKLDKRAYAVNVDCSTMAGMIFSMGGDVVSGNTTSFDSEASIRAFELIETMVKEGLAYQVTPGTYDDETALTQGEVAFAMRSSAGRMNMVLLMEGRQDEWGMAMIPQANPASPATVLYGPNICVFNTTPQQQQAGWDFIKFFTSKDVSVRWALGTGYVPMRKSAADNPSMQAFWAEWPYNRAAFDCLPYAKSEPNLSGWQEVRTLVENAETEVLTGIKPARQAAMELKQKADAVLARQ